MQLMSQAYRAYETTSGFRSLREQEADLFKRVNGALRGLNNAGPIQRVKALADNRRLWLGLSDVLLDPSNALPDDLRASMISVGIAVQREMDRESPDIDFLITVNDNVAAGLEAPQMSAKR
jgi:flagellar biosynthesis activator protein FlaF